MRSILHTALMIAAFGAGLVLVLAQPPAPKGGAQPREPGGYPPEDEEAIPAPLKRRVTIDEEGPPPVTVPPFCYYARLDDLARGGSEVRSPALKALLAKYLVAFDRITFTDNTTVRVCPVPSFRDGKFNAFFGVFKLNEINEPRKASAVDRNAVKRIDHFEELLIQAALRLVNSPTEREPADEAPAPERALVAEQLASAALQFCDTARDLGKRRGSGWDKVRAEIVAKLAEVRLARLKLAATSKDWATVRSLGTRMANLYPGNLALLEEVFAARLAEGVVAAESEQLVDLERARELLVEFESRFPGSKNPAMDQVRAKLQQQKKKIFDRATDAVRNENTEATRLLRTLEAIDPNYPGLRDLQGQLKTSYSILVVGVKRLPTHMSPVAARSDADRMAIELVFESLFDSCPDEALGVRYHPGLAAGFPGILSGARDVRLQRPVEWAGLPQQYADASDVAGTIRLLKGDYRGTWAAYKADWLAEQPRVENQSALRLRFAGGHPYPLAVLDFKILPTRWLAAQGWKADDPRFAAQPYGTGPYRALPGSDGRVTSFVANANYGRRPGRLGQPFIKEIRFVDVSKKISLPAEMKTEQIHILPDVPTTEIDLYERDPDLKDRVTVVTALQNRRVWMLAVNHRRPALRSVALRRGISHAIDRELILDQAYRGTHKEFHKALSGPFPPESWATPRQPTAPKPLFDLDVATAKFQEHVAIQVDTSLKLVIPANDTKAKTVADLLKKQIESAATGSTGKVTINIAALPILDFENTVYREGDYDLAYVSSDYPDDWYPFGLAAMLDPEATGPFGRNVGGYLDQQANISREDQELAQQLSGIRQHADYEGKILKLTHDLHRRFLEATPFVPLWQLDRHIVVTRKLQISFDGEGGKPSLRMLPASIFKQVGRWKLE